MNKKAKTSPLAKQVRKNSIGWMLKRLGSQLDLEMASELKQRGLNLNQFAVLMTLMEGEGLTQTEIGKKIKMPGYATTRTLDVLEANKYIERRTDEHSRRSYRIYLTKKGRDTCPELFVIVEKVNANLLSSISTTQQKQLKTILHELLIAKFE
ncbi:MAG: MarR family transcriptional regulator [Methylomarinum sp.]|nr:MarR family transcriptional regulator [Methylomarinum sp.]